MTTQRSEILIRAPLERVREILLKPLEFPEWNAAFTALTGPANPAEGDRYALTIRSGLDGSFSYEHIDARRIVVRWSTVGLRESATWSLEPNGDATRVVHEFDHEGGLALLLRQAFRTVAQQRNERLKLRAAVWPVNSCSAVVLETDLVRLIEVRRELFVDVLWTAQAECVQYVARRVDLDLPEPSVLDPSGEYQMSVEPLPSWDERGEAHPGVQGDAGLLGQDLHRSKGGDDLQHSVERRTDAWIRADEVPVDVTERCAGMGLVAVGKGTTALRALP
jgi:hypothetical protein